MSNDITDVNSPEEDESVRLMSKTQTARENLLDLLVDDTKNFDKDRVDAIVKVAAGIDKQEIDKKRVAAADKEADSSLAIARALELRMKEEEAGRAQAPVRRIIRDPRRLNTDFLGTPSESHIKSGALAELGEQESYDGFIERMENKDPSLRLTK